MAKYIDRLRDKIGGAPIIMVGASVLARDEQGRVLLQHKNETGKWGLPGGRMKLGETIKETAFRNLYEKTGIKADELKLTEIFSGEKFHDTSSDGDNTYNLIVLYEAQGISEDFFADESETLNVRYLYPDEVDNLEDKSLKILNRIGMFENS